MIDYKISRLTRDGGKTTALVRFYQGSMKDVDVDGRLVSQYVRTKLLAEKLFELPNDEAIETLRERLNGKLAERTTLRQKVITEQSNVKDTTKIRTIR